MKTHYTLPLSLGLCSAALVYALPPSTVAQTSAPPTYQADPDTYKLIFEDQNFRVIAATWKKGTTDKPHAHPVPFVLYSLDECTLRIHNPDGATRDLNGKAGTASTGIVTTSHTAENISPADCHAIFVEHK